MSLPRHTPYDGSTRPFTIGLQQLEIEDWIEPEPDLAHYLVEKRRLWAEERDLVFVEEAGTRPAQQELLDLLVMHLTTQQPDAYQRSGTVITYAGQQLDLADDSLPPLAKAGFLIADDLVILRRKEAGWTLVAAHLSFPSSWSLTEKFGKTMDQIHGPVPGFEAGTRNAALVNRMFDNLSRPVWRQNWSVNPTGSLYLPKPRGKHNPSLLSPVTPVNVFVRVERQTLLKMPASGDIVFTIRIHSDPLAEVLKHPQAPQFAGSFADQLEALSADEKNYKSITDHYAELVALLRAVAAPA